MVRSDRGSQFRSKKFVRLLLGAVRMLYPDANRSARRIVVPSPGTTGRLRRAAEAGNDAALLELALRLLYQRRAFREETGMDDGSKRLERA
jgi:hypothetical protein